MTKRAIITFLAILVIFLTIALWAGKKEKVDFSVVATDLLMRTISVQG
jgi:hypothetical protein